MKKLMIMLVVVAFLPNLASLADTANRAFSIKQDGQPNLVAKANAVLPKIVKACPGLDRYSADLSPASVETSHMRDYEGGITLIFQVSEKPQTLPSTIKIRSRGNTCYINISAENHRMYIAKTGCHSFCTGTLQENDHGMMGKEYNLN